MTLHMNEIKKKSDSDLKKLVAEKREAMRKIRFESAGSGTRDPHVLRLSRREIARILTELSERGKSST